MKCDRCKLQKPKDYFGYYSRLVSESTKDTLPRRCDSCVVDYNLSYKLFPEEI